MDTRAKLSEIVDGMEFLTDESWSFLNKVTGEVVTVTAEELRAAELDDPLDKYPQWQHPAINEARDILGDRDDTYVALPSKFDIDDYVIMEAFCISLEDENISESLCQAIRGSGAFRRFRDGIHKYGITDDWHRYKDEAMKALARKWCEENAVEYVED